jgi:hypothetical protein
MFISFSAKNEWRRRRDSTANYGPSGAVAHEAVEWVDAGSSDETEYWTVQFTHLQASVHLPTMHQSNCLTRLHAAKALDGAGISRVESQRFLEALGGIFVVPDC